MHLRVVCEQVTVHNGGALPHGLLLLSAVRKIRPNGTGGDRA